jgi:acetoin:2,6-dichlorophenolindophenol oxidoreductase subunit beta
LEHKRLYSIKGEASDEELSLGRAAVVRPGDDLTLVSCMKGVHDCLAAASELAADGIEAEVIDLRTLRPLDLPTVLDSVARTNRVLLVEEGAPTGGWSADLLALVTQQALHDLDDAWRITTPEHPIPYSPPLEDTFLPSPELIVESVKERLGVAAAR